jgi:hypothetical protein
VRERHLVVVETPFEIRQTGKNQYASGDLKTAQEDGRMASATTLVCGKCRKTSTAVGNPRQCTECGQNSVRIYAKKEGETDGR